VITERQAFSDDAEAVRHTNINSNITKIGGLAGFDHGPSSTRMKNKAQEASCPVNLLVDTQAVNADGPLSIFSVVVDARGVGPFNFGAQ
jgi:hypothetical protein